MGGICSCNWGAAVQFFSGLFSADQIPNNFDMLRVIPSLVTESNNCCLEAVPSPDEIKAVVFNMDGDSAPGPDGFSGKFFTSSWSIIGDDLVKAVQSFFFGAGIPRAVKATAIVLIPKVNSPQDFSQFRPISLCNFFNKIISKILADQLATFLTALISSQQSGFVKGRVISDNYLLA